VTAQRMNLSFEFATATRIVFGPGRIREIGALAKDLGRRALIVTGRDQDRARGLIGHLKAAGLDSSVFSVVTEPEVRTVIEGVAKAKQSGSDIVISFGGGSAIDGGKAIAAMLHNTGSLIDYLEVVGQGKALSVAPAPFIAIPTTAGTGSEVTRNAVLASPEHKVKVSLRSPLMLPRIALVDPELSYDLPPALTASTGLDALTQLIEPYVSCRANPMTDGLCVEAIPRAARSLPKLFVSGNNPEARQDLCLASLFGGLALANAGLGAVHGFAGPIGGMFPAPHGAVCAALLPHVMEINLCALREREPENPALNRYETLGRLLTGNLDATGDDGVDWVKRLVQDLKIPPLCVYGVEPESADEIVKNAARASSMKANPLTLTNDEMREVLSRASS
jgi:alcohol dehydrogenase class IV